MSLIVSVAPALPPHRYPQQEITDRFAELVLPTGTDRRVLDRMHSAAGVRTRHLALPIELPCRSAASSAANGDYRMMQMFGRRADHTDTLCSRRPVRWWPVSATSRRLVPRRQNRRAYTLPRLGAHTTVSNLPITRRLAIATTWREATLCNLIHCDFRDVICSPSLLPLTISYDR